MFNTCRWEPAWWRTTFCTSTSSTSRCSVSTEVNWALCWMKKAKPPPPSPGGRSRRTSAYPGKVKVPEAEVSLVSWIAANKILFSNWKVESWAWVSELIAVKLQEAHWANGISLKMVVCTAAKMITVETLEMFRVVIAGGLWARGETTETGVWRPKHREGIRGGWDWSAIRAGSSRKNRVSWSNCGGGVENWKPEKSGSRRAETLGEPTVEPNDLCLARKSRNLNRFGGGAWSGQKSSNQEGKCQEGSKES